MKKHVLFSILMVFSNSNFLYGCHFFNRLQTITNKLSIINFRMQQIITVKDLRDASDTIKDYEFIQPHLCIRCMIWSQQHTEMYIQKILAYFGLDS